MQVEADWHMAGTAQHLERELVGFKFEGPGFYLTKTDTLLVIPLDGLQDGVWQKTWPEESVFRVYVFNCQFGQTIFARIALAQVRSDTR